MIKHFKKYNKPLYSAEYERRLQKNIEKDKTEYNTTVSDRCSHMERIGDEWFQCTKKQNHKGEHKYRYEMG